MKAPEVQEQLAREGGLADRLRRARGEIKSKDLAARLRWPESKVSKLQRGNQLPTEDDLRAWAGKTGTDQIELDQWLAMLEEAQKAHQTFREQMRGGQAALQEKYNRLIKKAAALRFAEFVHIPRPLQVPEYTRAVLKRIGGKYESDRDADAGTAVRQASSVYLYDLTKHWELIIGQAVLHYPWPSVAVWRMQLDRLLSAVDLPTVRLGIYPMNRVNARLPAYSFEIYGDVVYIENELGDEPKVAPDALAKLGASMDEMWPDCLEGDAARDAIRRAIDALPRE